MCGLGTITLAKHASTTLPLDAAANTLALALEHRGGDATGLLTISAAGTCSVQKAVCGAPTFNKYRLAIDPGTRALVVHTRFATQGSEAFNRNNHPVAHGRALVAHNGVIWERVPRPHGAAEVDTWVLARSASECETRGKGETAQAHGERVALALADWEGSAAVAVAYRGVPFLVSARLEGSPLWVAEAHGVRVCASTRDAVADTFATLGIALPTQRWETQVPGNGKRKRGRKQKTRTVIHTQPKVTSMREGDVCVWHSGMHTRGHVKLPDRYTASRFDTFSVYSDSVSRAIGYTAEPTRDYTARIDTVAEALLAYERAERCGVCDTWCDGPLERYDGLPLCDECDSAMHPNADDATRAHE